MEKRTQRKEKIVHKSNIVLWLERKTNSVIYVLANYCH
jgi:hypothetical protein